MFGCSMVIVSNSFMILGAACNSILAAKLLEWCLINIIHRILTLLVIPSWLSIWNMASEIFAKNRACFCNQHYHLVMGFMNLSLKFIHMNLQWRVIRISSQIFKDSWISKDTRTFKDKWIYKDSWVFKDSWFSKYSCISKDSWIS